jgi:hypothetical protein
MADDASSGGWSTIESDEVRLRTSSSEGESFEADGLVRRVFSRH